MKIIASFLVGLLIGIGTGWFANQTRARSKETAQMASLLVSTKGITAEPNLVQARIDEAAQRTACLMAMQAIPIIDSAKRLEADKLLADCVATYYYNYAAKPTSNHDILMLRSRIVHLARTNSTVAAEIEAAGKLVQKHK